MSIGQYLPGQARLHPAMQPQDAAKLCWQAAMGAEHLLGDEEAARLFLLDEFERTPPDNSPLAEPISDAFARVNLAAWKQRGLSPEALFSLFHKTAQKPRADGRACLQSCLRECGGLAAQGFLPFSHEEWQDFLEHFDPDSGPIRHSAYYRRLERPAYRLVALPLLQDLL